MDFPNTTRRLGATIGIIAPPPPIGEPTFDGNFHNPDAAVVGSINLLPSVPATAPSTFIIQSMRASRLSGSTALTLNAIESLTANSVAMSNADSAVGSEGALGFQGAAVSSTPVQAMVAPTGPNGTVPKVSPTQLWQLNNPKVDAFIRIGGPIAAVYLWSKGNQVLAAAAALPAAYLWYCRLKHG